MGINPGTAGARGRVRIVASGMTAMEMQGADSVATQGDTSTKAPVILVVEDDPVLSLDLAELLGEWRYKVCGVARSGRDALEIVGRLRPDLALVDVGLRGGMDGIELAVRLRREHGIPSIILSGAVGAEIEQRAGPACPAAFLTKPYMPEELQKTLERIWPRAGP